MATSLANTTFFSKTCSLFIHTNSLKRFAFRVPFSSTSTSTSPLPLQKKWRPPAASALELGGDKMAKDDIVRDDPTNNVPDTIFTKLGMQLHKRNQHPIGILKNAIYEYFDSNYPNKFNKFDDLCPIVSVKQNFDDVLVPADHVSRSYNDTYYVDSQTVLRCHTSAHQAELLKEHNHFLVTGDVYRRDSIDSTHYPVFHQMEGVSIFYPDEWGAAGLDATEYAAKDLKRCLEGLARHLFGKTTLVFSMSASHKLNHKTLRKLFVNITCDCQVRLIDNFTNKKGMTSHCYRIAYRSMERSLTDEEINELQWNVREQVQSKLNVVLR
ncbi:hypothetical protein CUMW_076850 [Citrus unshiu]|nr:hypothetical protein CUMW_076850 [Citrus unshiu]